MLKRWWPTLLTLLIVLYATLWPDPAGSGMGLLFEGADKLIHAIMMGGLLSAVFFDRRRSGFLLTTRFKTSVFVIMLVFSALDEWAQDVMMLGRSFDMLDIGADWGGIIVALLTAPPVINSIFKNKTGKSVEH